MTSDPNMSRPTFICGILVTIVCVVMFVGVVQHWRPVPKAEKLIAMHVTAFVPNGATLKEAWTLDSKTTLQNCIEMQRIFAGGGSAGVITVKCDGPAN